MAQVAVNETEEEKAEFKKFGGEWIYQTNYRQMFVQILSVLPKIKVTINVFLATSFHLWVHRLLQKVFPLQYL